MRRIVKNTILKYLPTDFQLENDVQPERIFDFNNKPIKNGFVVYFCDREIRCKDNFALQFALKKSQELDLPLKIIIPHFSFEQKSKQNFINRQIITAGKCFKNAGLDFAIFVKGNLINYLNKINTALLITDFNPIENKNFLDNADFKIYETDSHNIVPTRFASNKQEYNAATYRRKIYGNIFKFLTEFSNITTEKTEADLVLQDFIKNKLQYYAEFKNNPVKNVSSGLSVYLNLGFISSQRVALEVVKSDVSDESKEAFLEELIVRKELADNFCLHCKDFKTFDCISQWAKNSLNAHKNDIRGYLYSLEDFEQAKTHDKLWNATQNQLKTEGKIQGYLRMYWAKKISEWTQSPQEALNFAIYLNDKYAYDAPSPNGYVGILWSIGALHDRAFQDYFVTGKIRRMTLKSIKTKFDIIKYIKNFSK